MTCPGPTPGGLPNAWCWPIFAGCRHMACRASRSIWIGCVVGWSRPGPVWCWTARSRSRHGWMRMTRLALSPRPVPWPKRSTWRATMAWACARCGGRRISAWRQAICCRRRMREWRPSSLPTRPGRCRSGAGGRRSWEPAPSRLPRRRVIVRSSWTWRCRSWPAARCAAPPPATNRSRLAGRWMPTETPPRMRRRDTRASCCRWPAPRDRGCP